MRSAWLLCAVVALGGCASPGSREAVQTDEARIQAVERAARLHGVTVVWINEPRKHAGPGS